MNHATGSTPRPRASRAESLALVATALAAALPLLALLRAPVQGPDEGLLLVHPENVLAGGVSNRDFATVYGPMTYWMLAAAFWLFEPSLYTERLVGVAYRVVLAVAMACLLRRTVGRGAAFAAAVTSLLLQTQFVPLAYAYYGALACVVSGLALLGNSRGPWLRALGAALIGLASAYRLEMGVLALAALPLMRGFAKTPVLVGWLCGLLPGAIHLLVAREAVYADVIRGRAAVNAQVGWISPQLVAVVIAMLAVSILVLVLARRNHDQRLAAAGLLCLLLLPQAVQRLDVSHVVFAGSVIVPVGAACALRRPPILREGLGSWMPSAVAGVVGALAVLFVLPLSSPTVVHGARFLHVAPIQRDTLEDVMVSIDEVSAPGEAVFVGPQDMSRPVLTSNFLYHLMPERPRPFRFVEFLPGTTEQAGSGLVEDLSSADVLVLEDLTDLAERLTPNMPDGAQEANEAVARDFCTVRVVDEFVVKVRRPRC